MHVRAEQRPSQHMADLVAALADLLLADLEQQPQPVDEQEPVEELRAVDGGAR